MSVQTQTYQTTREYTCTIHTLHRIDLCVSSVAVMVDGLSVVTSELSVGRRGSTRTHTTTHDKRQTGRIRTRIRGNKINYRYLHLCCAHQSVRFRVCNSIRVWHFASARPPDHHLSRRHFTHTQSCISHLCNTQLLIPPHTPLSSLGSNNQTTKG